MKKLSFNLNVAKMGTINNEISLSDDQLKFLISTPYKYMSAADQLKAIERYSKFLIVLIINLENNLFDRKTG